MGRFCFGLRFWRKDELELNVFLYKLLFSFIIFVLRFEFGF